MVDLTYRMVCAGNNFARGFSYGWTAIGLVDQDAGVGVILGERIEKEHSPKRRKSPTRR